MRERLPLPKAIQNAPELDIGLELYYGAFFDLHTCRPSGFSVGPIPWSAMHDYARVWELDEEQTMDLFEFIREMDKAYLEWHDKKAGKGKETPPKKA